MEAKFESRTAEFYLTNDKQKVLVSSPQKWNGIKTRAIVELKLRKRLKYEKH